MKGILLFENACSKQPHGNCDVTCLAKGRSITRKEVDLEKHDYTKYNNGPRLTYDLASRNDSSIITEEFSANVSKKSSPVRKNNPKVAAVKNVTSHP